MSESNSNLIEALIRLAEQHETIINLSKSQLSHSLEVTAKAEGLPNIYVAVDGDQTLMLVGEQHIRLEGRTADVSNTAQLLLQSVLCNGYRLEEQITRSGKVLFRHAVVETSEGPLTFVGKTWSISRRVTSNIRVVPPWPRE